MALCLAYTSAPRTKKVFHSRMCHMLMHTIVHCLLLHLTLYLPPPPLLVAPPRFTFEVAGEFYMIPAHDNEADIRLFRCVKWPSKWKFEATLLQPSNQVADVSLVQWQVHVTSRPAWGNDLTVVVA